MPPQMKGALDKLTGAVQQFTIAQRTLALIGIAGLVLGGLALSSWMSKPTMSPLFSGVSAEDAAAITDVLTADGVTYQLADGGATILVPNESVYPERLKVAAAGLPASSEGDGYSLLDTMSMTSSDFQQRTTYTRALQGELAKTIEAMDGVQTASVKLAIPEETVFTAEKADPTASVFVKTRAGSELTSDQVQAVVHLVSAGIEGMQPTDVTVVDAEGKVLSAAGSGLSGSTSDAASDYETKVAGSVQAMLDRVLGAGNAAVTVVADVDSSQSDTTTETFTQTPGVGPLSSSTTNESYSGSGSSSATGVLGPDNIMVPDGSDTTGTSGDGGYVNTSEDVTNAINKTTERKVTPAGGISRQSVSVAINSSVAGTMDAAALQQMIAAAAGIDTTRGDTVAVTQLAFDTTGAEAAQTALAAADAEQAAAAQTELIKQAAIAGAVLLLVIILVIMGARRSKRARREALDLGELAAAQAAAAGDPALRALEAADANDRLTLGAGNGPLPELPSTASSKRDEITALADESPAEVAEMLRGWLAEPAGRRR